LKITNRTKILIAVFLLAAFALYAVIYIFPKITGIMEKTQVLEYGSLSISDTAEVLILRDETLYVADSAGGVSYAVAEGTKVRSGVQILWIDPSVAAPEGEEAAAGAEDTSTVGGIKSIAGKDAQENPGNVSPITAVVSYHADGYEKTLSPDAYASLTKEAAAGYPVAGTDLTRTYTKKGDPLYKITDNNVWYMVYWPEKADAEKEYYVSGQAVTVRIGEAEIAARVQDCVKEGGSYKVLLRSDVYYSDMARIRRVQAVISFDEYMGLIMDESCIQERDGVTGVYVKQTTGDYKWVPVNVKSHADGQCVVSAVRFYDAEGNEVLTVTYYDEVLKNPGDKKYD